MIFSEDVRKMLDFGFYNMDCMEGMKEFPDKYFGLAIVDPPYGIGINSNIGRRKGDRPSGYPKPYWDNKTPEEHYFQELFRVSKKQIIWGGNYFNLPPTKCFLIWRKPQISEDVSFSMCEYTWTNLDGTAKEWIGMSNEKDRIHATQKPVALYKWILNRYASRGDIILDTHVGSASSLIACNETGLKFVGFEIDEYYYKKASERLQTVMNQQNLFSDYRMEYTK